jgi:hypothetical protein
VIAITEEYPLDYPLNKMDAGIRTMIGDGSSRIKSGQNGGGMKVAVLSDGYGWLRFYSENEDQDTVRSTVFVDNEVLEEIALEILRKLEEEGFRDPEKKAGDQ